RLVQVEPLDQVVLVVVLRHVPADRLHQVEVNHLVESRVPRDEVVLYRADRRDQARLQAGLLGDLAQRGLLERLARVGGALRQAPGPGGAAADQDALLAGLRALPVDDAAGRDGAGAAQPGGRAAAGHAVRWPLWPAGRRRAPGAASRPA